MSAESTSQTKNAASAPTSWTGRLRLIGPGIVLALASVGASDMITTMNSGAEYGLALIWVFTVGIVLKFVLSEAVLVGIGRYGQCPRCLPHAIFSNRITCRRV